jgi:hypothetical protein
VPSLAVQDTARFTIRPGQPARVTLASRDTFVYVGTTITFRPLAIDPAGNLASAAPTLEGPNALTIAGASVTATAFGVHQLTARAGALTDVVKVSVVPRGSIAAVESYTPREAVIIAFDLDGTTPARISTNNDVDGLTWTPDGAAILYARPDGLMQYRLYKATLAGWLAEFPRQVVIESRNARAGGATILTRMAELLFVDVVRRYMDGLSVRETAWLAGLRDPVVGPALTELHQRPSHPWTLVDLARAVATSRTVLTERFMQLVGIPPM